MENWNSKSSSLRILTPACIMGACKSCRKN
jgi:hypothetical protein